MITRWTTAVGSVGVLALVVGLAVVDRYHVGVFHDDAMYVILARSLAEGEGYRYLNLPGAPSATHFPPGYPFVLSLIWRALPAFPANVVVFKALNAVCLGASAVLTMYLVRDRLKSVWLAAAAGVATAISVPLLVLSTMLLSEMLFLALLLGVLIVAERHVHVERAANRALALGILIGVATLVRTHGIVLVPAVAIPLLLKRRWGEAGMVAAGALALLVPWQLWSSANAGALPPPLAGNYGSYVSWWRTGFERDGLAMIGATVSRTLPETTGMLTSLFSPARGAVAHGITLVLLGLSLAAGVFALASRASVTLLFLSGYLSIVLLWPFPPSRFVWGVWPLLLFLLMGAASSAVGGSGRLPRAARYTLAASLAWLFVGYVSYEIRATRGEWWGSISRSADRRIAPAVAWTLANTSRDEVIAADDEGALYLYTGRLAVPVASFTTHHYLRERSAVVEATEGLVPILQAYPIRTVIVGTRRMFDAAQHLSTRALPLLAPREEFSAGAVFSVLKR